MGANTTLAAASAAASAATGQTTPAPPLWTLSELSGRLTELSAVGDSACLTLAFSLVLDAQMQIEPVAWVTDSSSSFFPHDVAASGVDLAAIAVVRVQGPSAIARAADRLARSGAFGLVVLDLGQDARISMALQARLHGLAQKHDAAILCLTEKSGNVPSLGSMVSLRGEAHRQRTAEGRFTCELQVIKDKRRGPGWTHAESFRGRDGFF